VIGVERLVLGSLKVLRDPVFQSIAVSAERWAPLEEVPPAALVPWLRGMRNRGYALVGVEQTAGSVPLQQFRFAPRTVLVLGKEREGVAPEVLQEMDACVVIPQRGIIRSLNVHVCGAMVLWCVLRAYWPCLSVLWLRLLYGLISRVCLQGVRSSDAIEGRMIGWPL
jgi:hypothetical protein